MQTFLPYESFQESLACLDRQRLGKQRVEAFQIINTLEGQSSGWRNHPAVLMWDGYLDALKLYYLLSLEAWAARGYNNIKLKPIAYNTIRLEFPSWLGDPAFHASHRSNLLRKNPEHYGQFGWSESPDLPYVWPVQKDDATRIEENGDVY